MEEKRKWNDNFTIHLSLLSSYSLKTYLTKFKCESLIWFFSDPPVITTLQVLNGPTVSENEAVTLRCEADSNPVPIITWLFLTNQTELKREYGVHTSSYAIPNTNCFHTGIYQCQAANNRSGVISSYAKDVALNVLCK